MPPSKEELLPSSEELITSPEEMPPSKEELITSPEEMPPSKEELLPSPEEPPIISSQASILFHALQDPPGFELAEKAAPALHQATLLHCQ